MLEGERKEFNPIIKAMALIGKGKRRNRVEPMVLALQQMIEVETYVKPEFLSNVAFYKDVGNVFIRQATDLVGNTIQNPKSMKEKMKVCGPRFVSEDGKAKGLKNLVAKIKDEFSNYMPLRMEEMQINNVRARCLKGFKREECTGDFLILQRIIKIYKVDGVETRSEVIYIGDGASKVGSSKTLKEEIVSMIKETTMVRDLIVIIIFEEGNVISSSPIDC
ncbi:hypothetical protein HAX54_024959 [Datura stramonium]|uniref:Uncharacterized protein n=1 Tax=Datura stramonium TaxID=4076 RepID=A0ABS8UYX6_DATST|nr:hypothetical protein [Datura stramonium]